MKFEIFLQKNECVLLLFYSDAIFSIRCFYCILNLCESCSLSDRYHSQKLLSTFILNDINIFTSTWSTTGPDGHVWPHLGAYWTHELVCISVSKYIQDQDPSRKLNASYMNWRKRVTCFILRGHRDVFPF